MPIVQSAPEETMLPGENPASAGMGHNRPPLEELIPMEFREELLRDRPDFLSLVDKFIDAANRVRGPEDEPGEKTFVITNDETLGRAGEMVNKLRAAIQHVEATHKTVKAPYLEGGRLVDAEKNGLCHRLTAAKGLIEAHQNTFVAKRLAERRAEEARIAEEQRRQAAEAAAAAAAGVEAEPVAMAAAAPKKAEPVRSDTGAVVSSQTVWESRVTDHAKAFKAVKSDPKVKEAIEAAIKRLVKAGQREIAGVDIWETAKATNR